MDPVTWVILAVIAVVFLIVMIMLLAANRSNDRKTAALFEELHRINEREYLRLHNAKKQAREPAAEQPPE